MLTLHTNKHPLCCGVGKIESLENTMCSMHGVPSAAIIGSNYVRCDAETSPDHQI